MGLAPLHPLFINLALRTYLWCLPDQYFDQILKTNQNSGLGNLDNQKHPPVEVQHDGNSIALLIDIHC